MYIYLITILLLLPIPLLILHRKGLQKKQERSRALELKKAFTQLSRRYKLSIDEVEIFESKIIGLDKKSNKLILIEYVGNSLRKNCIPLNELESHRVIKDLDRIAGCINEVFLEFKFNYQKPVNFTFYDSAKDNISAFSFLRDKAKYWDAKIHFHVNSYNSNHAFEYVS